MAQSYNQKAGTTLNKSLETVIRKAAYKGIEPLRRRYTAVTQAAHAHASYNGAAQTTRRSSNLNSSTAGNASIADNASKPVRKGSTHDSNQYH